MHVSAKDFLLALTIGAEVFAIAALWPLSEWAVAERRRLGFVVALLVIAACVALCTLGFVPPPAAPGGWRRVLGHAVGWAPLPLFIGLPDAVCVASGQSLARAGVSARHARPHWSWPRWRWWWRRSPR